MLKFFLEIFQTYGLNVLALTIIIGLLGYIVKILWKLQDNHLAHIQSAINDSNKKIDRSNDKIDDLNKTTVCLAERVSKIEGKLEIGKTDNCSNYK